jgi:hypothetical protein
MIAVILLTVAIIVNHPDPGPESEPSKTTLNEILSALRAVFGAFFAPFALVIRALWFLVWWLLNAILKIPLIGPVIRACVWVISLPFKIIGWIVNPTWADAWGPEPAPCDGFAEQLTKLNEAVRALSAEMGARGSH